MLGRSFRNISRENGVMHRCIRPFSAKPEKMSIGELRTQLGIAVGSATKDQLVSLYRAGIRIGFENMTKDTSSAPPITVQTPWSEIAIMKPCKPHPYATGLFAVKSFKKDEVILDIKGTYIDHPTFESFQMDVDKHYLMEQPSSLLNHSFDANGFINFETMQYCALREIEENEELTWNYLTTEWDLQRPFEAECGREVKGFKHLSQEEQEVLGPWLSPSLKKKINQ